MLSIATRAAVRLGAAPTLTRSLAIRASSVHTLPDLPYAYNVRPRPCCISLVHTHYFFQALEPYISEEIMRLHHTKHHQAYVNGLNAAEESYAAAKSVKEQIALQAALKFNGGGRFAFIDCRSRFITYDLYRTYKPLSILDQPRPRFKPQHVSLLCPHAIQGNRSNVRVYRYVQENV